MKKYSLVEQEVNGEKVELIEFYDEHTYKVADKYYPSISKKLGIIDKGYGFHQWERQVGMQADEIMARAAESGTKIHNAIEYILLGNDLEADDQNFNFTLQEWKKVLSFVEWWNYYGFKPLYIEQIVYDLDLETAGKLDLIAEREGMQYVIDFKTGNDLYDSYNQQVQFYKNCSVKLGLVKEDAIPMLVHIGSKHKKIDEKKLQGVNVGCSVIEQEIANKKLSVAISAWDLHNQDWKAPTLIYPKQIKLNNVLKSME